MKNQLLYPSIVALINAGLMVYGVYYGPPALVYVTKPATMIAIIFLAAFGSGTSGRSRYQNLIIMGLLFSIVGDIFLMLPGDMFIQGLIAFLIAHLVYIAGMIDGVGWATSKLRLTNFILLGVVLTAILWPDLGDMRIPVALYILAILIMGWRAWERWAILGGIGPKLAAAGAMLFIISDFILALNRFKEPFFAARAMNLSTYFAAQWLLAMSVHRQK